MKTMSLNRLLGIIIEVIGIITGVVRCDRILAEVEPAMFILGFMIMVLAIMVTAFPESAEEDC